MCYSIVFIILKIFLRETLTILWKQMFKYLNAHLERFTASTKLNPHLRSSKCPPPTYTAGLEKASTPTRVGGRNYVMVSKNPWNRFLIFLWNMADYVQSFRYFANFVQNFGSCLMTKLESSITFETRWILCPIGSSCSKSHQCWCFFKNEARKLKFGLLVPLYGI